MNMTMVTTATKKKISKNVIYRKIVFPYPFNPHISSNFPRKEQTQQSKLAEHKKNCNLKYLKVNDDDSLVLYVLTQ